MSDVLMKRCKKCGQEFPATSEFFTPCKRGSLGLQPRCKTCRAEDSRLWRLANSDLVKAQAQCYYAEHQEEIRLRGRDYRARTADQQRERQKRYRETHRNEVNTYQKMYRQEHPDTERLKIRKYRQTHQEQIRENKRAKRQSRAAMRRAEKLQWEVDHPEEVRRREVERQHQRQEWRDQWNACQRERTRLRREQRQALLDSLPQPTTRTCPHCQQVYPATPEYFRLDKCTQRLKECRNCARDQNHAWKKRHPDIVSAQRRVSKHKRRAQRHANGGHHTASDVLLLLKTQKRRCWWCGQNLVGNAYEVDHRIPLAKGGSDNAENLCITCKDCNRDKSDKLPQEWNGRLL